MALGQIEHDGLRDPPARLAFEDNRQPEFEHLTQRQTIAVLLTERELRHDRPT